MCLSIGSILAGCSGQPNIPSNQTSDEVEQAEGVVGEDAEMSIVESAIVPVPDSVLYLYIAVVRNPRNKIAMNVYGDVDFIDSSGAQLATLSPKRVSIYPHDTALIVELLDLETDPVGGLHSRAKLFAAGFAEVSAAPGRLLFRQLGITHDDDGCRLRGMAINNGTRSQANFDIRWIGRRNGKIVAGGDAYMDYVPREGTGLIDTYSSVDQPCPSDSLTFTAWPHLSLAQMTRR